MKVAIIGSRNLFIPTFKEYLPDSVTEIVSGGANGIDTAAAVYAQDNNLNLTEFLPEYKKYGKAAPIKRNDLIIDYADMIFAFWDGKSRGTKYVIDKALKKEKKVVTYIAQPIKEVNRLTKAILPNLIDDVIFLLDKELTNCPEEEIINKSKLNADVFEGNTFSPID